MDQKNPAYPAGRISSIDALRGFTMFWIIGGDRIMRSLPEIHDNAVFRFLDQQLRHVEWEGFHFYDLIFPMFLFVIGVVQPFSVGKRLEKGVKKSSLHKAIFQRATILFFLGLIYYGIKDPNLKSLGYYGVLQLLAVGYLFSTLIMVHCNIRETIFWTIGILLSYFLLLTLIPVPGIGAGVLTPEGNMSHYIGELASHSFSPKFRKVLTPYMLSPISTALLGILAGFWLRRKQEPVTTFKGLLLGGLALILLALGWSAWFPVIKNLWTGSYVLLTAGISAVLLALFYWIIDVKGWSRWSFFLIVIGLNPISIYMLARIVDFRALAIFLTHGIAPYLGRFENLILAVLVTLFHWLLVYWMYKRRIFLKI